MDKIVIIMCDNNSVTHTSDITDFIKQLDIKGGYKFSREKPMNGVSFNKTRKKYLITNDNKLIRSDNLLEICGIKKEYIISKMKHKYKYVELIDDIEICKTYPEIVSFNYNSIELFDIKHVLTYINLGETCVYNKLQILKKDKIYVAFNKNEFGGYQIRTLIDSDSVKKILGKSSKLKARKLAEMLGINVCDIFLSTKEQTHIGMISDVFADEEMIDQFPIGIYRIDLYFTKYKLAIECDEDGHYSRDKNYEKRRQKYIESHDVSFIRFNPDELNFSICKVLGNIHMFMMKYPHN